MIRYSIGEAKTGTSQTPGCCWEQLLGFCRRQGQDNIDVGKVFFGSLLYFLIHSLKFPFSFSSMKMDSSSC